uniref:Uncharacterized protein n=2 Tax=Lygus hesperus TaxID=30085 RepID=A0A0K8SRL2_LYGHE
MSCAVFLHRRIVAVPTVFKRLLGIFSLNMAGSLWLVTVLLIEIVMCKVSEKSRYETVMVGSSQPTDGSARVSNTVGDVSRIENMLNKLGQNVCQRFTGYGGCGSCDSCHPGNSHHDCSEWMNDKPKKTSSEKEMLEKFFENLKAEIGKLREEMKQCCQGSKDVKSSDEFSALLTPIINNQETIINSSRELMDTAKQSAESIKGLSKKTTKEWSAMRSTLEAESAQFKAEMKSYYKKYNLCPEVKKLKNDVGDDTWRITQTPIIGSRHLG